MKEDSLHTDGDAGAAGPIEAPRDDKAAAVCPFAVAAAAPLTAAEPLFVPHPKRLVWAYDETEKGRELRINYGVKEITFDEEHFFAFGEQLVNEPQFTGERAMAWGPGYRWDELSPMLEALLDEGILARGVRAEDPRGTGLVPSRVPPSRCPAPRSWSLAECEAITRDLAGRAVEVGHLEAVVPVFRIPHPALDGDGRQVGEANVFPARLRLHRETEWRVCQYSGSRYRDETPMNVTALKAMIKHWKPMMAVIAAARAELAARLGLGAGGWTIGQLHVFSSVVCALPAFELMLGGGGSPRLPLHPVLSSMFRVTDGVRMTTYEMLFDVDATRGTGEPMTAAELYAHAERNGSMMGSKTGVCAGPRPMIEEYLAVVVDGASPERFAGTPQAPEVQALLDRLPEAIDYGLRGMQSWGLALSIWLAQSQAYEALLPIFESVRAGDTCAPLRARLRADRDELGTMQMSREHDRDVHRLAYVDAYEVSWRALRAPVGRARHADETAEVAAGELHEAAGRELGRLLRARLMGSKLTAGTAMAVERIVAILVRHLRREQAILAAVAANQEAINALLERPRPERPLTALDLRTVYLMSEGTYPHLFESLEAELGIRVECTANAITVSDRWASQALACPTA